MIADKIGPKKVLATGFCLFSLVYLGLGLIKSDFWIWFLFPLYGLYMGLTDGVGKAYIASLVPTEKAGTAFGAYLMATGLCLLFASVAAGFLWKYVGSGAPFIFGSLTSVIAVVWFMASGRKSKKTF